MYRTPLSAVQLWYMNNYHWYLKQELSLPSHTPNHSPASLTGILWDPIAPLKLHLLTHGQSSMPVSMYVCTCIYQCMCIWYVCVYVYLSMYVYLVCMCVRVSINVCVFGVYVCTYLQMDSTCATAGDGGLLREPPTHQTAWPTLLSLMEVGRP